MARYGLVIDLERCIGCMTCTIACKVENGTRPDIFWNIVKDQEFGKYPNVTRIFLPVQCAHCAEPPCVDVCPTGASYKREDGIVLVDYENVWGVGIVSRPALMGPVILMMKKRVISATC